MALAGCALGIRPEAVPRALEATVTFESVLGATGSSGGHFFGPSGVAVDAKGADDLLYVADTGNQRVQYLNSSSA